MVDADAPRAVAETRPNDAIARREVFLENFRVVPPLCIGSKDVPCPRPR